MSLHDEAAYAVKLAQDAGAQGAWARASRTREVEFTGRDGTLEKVSESTSRSLRVEVYVDGRYSAHSTTSLRPDRVESFVAEAVALTRALAEDPDRALPDPALFEGRPTDDLQIADSAVAEITREQRQSWLDGIDSTARVGDKVISATAYFGDSRTEGAAVSSNGFAGDWTSTAVWVGGEVTVRDEGDKRPEGGWWLGVRNVADLPEPEEVGAEALRRATVRLGSTQGPTTKTTMVVDPQAGSRLLRALVRPASARSIHQGRSYWTGKTGEKLFSDLVTVTDDPLIPRGLASRHFDGEGIAARPLELVDAGKVAGVYADTYYGRKTGMAPTTGSPSNIVLASGSDKDLAGLLYDIGEGIYVTSWLGGNSDSTTGDFSFGIRGHHVHKGQIGPSIGEMNVSGNLVDLFGSLVAVGNDPWPYRSMRTPTMVFEGVQFSGA